MDSQVLKYADNVKYLGFTFSSDQKDDKNKNKNKNNFISEIYDVSSSNINFLS